MIFAVASSALFLYDQSALQHVTECKKNAWIVMKKLMQGKENNTSGVGGIGNGEIGKINVLSLTGKHLFSITTESKKTLYLREYISSDYRNGRWENTQKETNLCKGEVSAALPFAFSELGFQKKNFSRQREVIIEYPQKKDTYGYLPVPYFADLNNVAGIVSGDGSVVLEKGRLEYRVQYYEVKNLQRLLKANGKIKQKVKKSIEEGSPKDYYLKAMKEYNTYVKEHNLFIPKNIQKELEKEIQTSLNGKTLEQKIDWVKKYIKTHYHYTYQPGGTPKGMDPILYFYGKSKKGFCTQYASLTVMMLRMAGVPARYVEGYKISENEFQGTRADVTDYNVHAWAEIYLENTGWIPIDTT
ncbi:transglutaminase-like domain-containing protein, partial [Anaerostipes sp.]|uniref:transglutaminase-like domain-containing protein n=1 Tax=Anaerostipes sp. TaxID=1872530 RepID=UPI003FF0D649